MRNYWPALVFHILVWVVNTLMDREKTFAALKPIADSWLASAELKFAELQFEEPEGRQVVDSRRRDWENQNERLASRN